MYYSEKQFCDYAETNIDYFARALNSQGLPRTRKGLATLHKKAMDQILNRNVYGGVNVWKWYRPWVIVPALRNFQAPEGDFGVGIEIELGFTSLQAAQNVARAVRNWRHITLDFEGGSYPIEATFPPSLYSKFNSKSQPCRYLKLIQEAGVVHPHSPNSLVGTHINVSVGGQRHNDKRHRRERVNNYIANVRDEFSYEMMSKYFGRRPYGGIYSCGTHYECKMFNSVTDWKVLRRYVDISVELIKLIESEEVINVSSVIAACERGYTLRS